MAKNIVITGGSLQATSRGIVALVLGAISAIQSQQPDARFTIIGSKYAARQRSGVDVAIGDGAQAREYRVRARQLPTLLLLALVASFLPGPLRRRLLARNAPLQAIAQADAVVSLCAGDSFSDIYGYRQFALHYLLDLTAVLLHRPLVIFPQTIGPFKSLPARLMARFLLRRARLVFTRESFSSAVARGLLGARSGKLVETADLAFLMRPEAVDFPRRDPAQPRVGINVSGFMYFFPVARTLTRGLDYAGFTRGLIERFVNDYGAEVVLVPHDYEPGAQKGDLAACQALYDSLDPALRGRVVLLSDDYRAPQLKGLIGTCDFFVGARLHACIAAASMRVPVTPIAYSYKFAGVMAKVGLGDCVCDPQRETPEQMQARILDAFERRAAVRAHLQATLPAIEAQVAVCGERLSALLEGARMGKGRAKQNAGRGGVRARLKRTFYGMLAQSRLLAGLYYGVVSDAFASELRALIAGRTGFDDEKGITHTTQHLRLNIHRLEKGLLALRPKEVFATGFIEDTLDCYERALQRNGAGSPCELQWAHDVLTRYFDTVSSHPVVDRARARFSAIPPVAGDDVAHAPYLRSQSRPSPVCYDELMALAQRRRSVRWYLRRPVPRELLDQAMLIAALSPSGCNLQPFEFRILDDPRLIAAMAPLAPGIGSFADNLPVLVALVGKMRALSNCERERHRIYVDASLAAMSFMYALETLDLSSCPYDWPEGAERDRQAARLLGLSADERIIMLLSVGYADPAGWVAYSQKKELRFLRRYNNAEVSSGGDQ